MTTYVVMAAGEGTRWGNYTGVPKHLCDPSQTGEPLIARLCRQLGERGQWDIALAGPAAYAAHLPPTVKVFTPPVLADGDDWLGATKFANAIPWWSRTGRTVVLYGDIWLDDDAMDAIVGNTERDWLNWCRFGASKITGCGAGENFAVSFYPEHQETYLAAMREAVQAHRDGVTKRSGGWEIARVMGGAHGELIRKHREYPHYRELGGRCDDFDKPADLDRWRDNRAKRA